MEHLVTPNHILFLNLSEKPLDLEVLIHKTQQQDDLIVEYFTSLDYQRRPEKVINNFDVVIVWMIYPDFSLNHLRNLLNYHDLANIIVILANENLQEDCLYYEASAKVLAIGVFACLSIQSSTDEIFQHLLVATTKSKQKKIVSEFFENLYSEKSKSVNDVANLTLDCLKHLVGWDKATMTLLWKGKPKNSPHGTFLYRTLLSYKGYSPEQINMDLLNPVDADELISDAINKGRPVIYPDLLNYRPNNWNIKPQTKDVLSWIGLPLILGGQPIGLITLDHRNEKFYDTVNENLLKEIADQAAVAIDSKLRGRNLETIRLVMQEISTKQSIEELLLSIMRWLRRVLKSTRCTYFQRREYVANGKNETYAEFFIDERGTQPKEGRFQLKEGEGIAGWVLRHGESLIINDTLTTNVGFISRSEDWNNPRSMLAVPVIVGNRTIGVINIDHSDEGFFSGYDLELVEILAAQVATVIERTRTLGLLSETSSDVSKSITEQEVLFNIINNAMRLTNATSGVIHLFESEDGYYLPSVKSYNFPEKFEHPKPRPDGLTKEILSTRGIVQFAQYNDTESKIHPTLTKRGIIATLGAPLFFENEIIGVLYLHSPSKVRFNDVEEFSLKLFAEQATFAIDKAKRIQELQNQTQLLAGQTQALTQLNDAARAVAQNDQLKDTFREIAKQGFTLIGAKYSHLARVYLHKGQRIIRFVAAYPDVHLEGLNEKVGSIDLVSGSQICSGKLGITGLAVKNRKTILIKDTSVLEKEDPELANHYIAYQEDTRSELAVPIFDKLDRVGEVIGVINIEHPDAGALTEAHQQLIELFAAQAALAIQKDVLLSQTSRHEAQLKQLAVITEIIASSSPDSLEVVMQEAVKHICKALYAKDVIVIRMINNDDEEISNNLSVDPKFFSNNSYEPKLVVRQDETSISKNVFLSRQLHPILDVQKDESVNPYMKEAGVRSAICLPLNLRNRCMGVMWIHFEEPRIDDYKESELELFQLYGNQIALVYDVKSQAQADKEELKKLQEEIADDLNSDYQDVRKYARYYSIMSVLTSTFGLFLLLGGLFGVFQNWEPDIFFGRNPTVISSLLGTIIEVIGILIFRRADVANQRMDRYHNELIEVRHLSILLESSDNELTKFQKEIIKRASDFWF